MSLAVPWTPARYSARRMATTIGRNLGSSDLCRSGHPGPWLIVMQCEPSCEDSTMKCSRGSWLECSCVARTGKDSYKCGQVIGYSQKAEIRGRQPSSTP